MFNPILQKLGLSENEARLYELLLAQGASKASDLVEPSGLGRGNVYNILTGLVTKGVVVMTEGKQQTYQIADPNALSALVDNKLRDAMRLSEEFREELPRIASAYKLVTGRPTIQVFEGLAGAEEAVEDSLNAPDGIDAYVDVEALTPEMQASNARYVQRRIKKGVLKRLILPDTPEIRARYGNMKPEYAAVTKLCFIKDFPFGHKTAVEMYGNRVSYLTLEKDRMIAVVIDDANIAQMHRAQFDFLWNTFAER